MRPGTMLAAMLVRRLQFAVLYDPAGCDRSFLFGRKALGRNANYQSRYGIIDPLTVGISRWRERLIPYFFTDQQHNNGLDR
jgi:hypothetical protein